MLRIINGNVVPQASLNQTKAMNYGMNLAKGDYITIYDAEDMPDVWQLKKSGTGF